MCVCVQVAALNYDELASATDGFSGSDLREACRAAAVSTVREYMQEETRRGGQASVFFLHHLLYTNGRNHSRSQPR